MNDTIILPFDTDIECAAAREAIMLALEYYLIEGRTHGVAHVDLPTDGWLYGRSLDRLYAVGIGEPAARALLARLAGARAAYRLLRRLDGPSPGRLHPDADGRG